MNKNKQLVINLISTLLVLIINVGINFFLSPFIISKIGEEAFGYISLANNFVSYATIFTSAINSLSGRFITIEIHRGNKESANKYFTSILFANLFIIIILIIPSIILIYYLENIINISSNLLIDAKLLFLLIFINFFITLISGVFSVATYSTNKLYLSSIKNMEATILKALILVVMFMFFVPSVYYVGLATLISTLFIVIANVKFTKKLLPEIKIKRMFFSIKNIKTILFSGIWNSVTNLGNVLMDGLHLLICNLMISPTVMGIVAISKIPGSIFNNFIATVSNVFQPQMTIYYAKDDINSIVRELKKGMKITSIFGSIPFCFMVVMGHSFFKLWIPDSDTNMLYIISVISFFNIYVGGIINPMYGIYTITNKLKVDAILRIISGFISTLISIILLKTTSLGVYSIVGVSTILSLILGFGFVPIYVCKCLGIKRTTFFPTIARYLFTTIVMLVIFFIIKPLLIANNWLILFVSVGIYGALGIIINFFLLFTKEERNFMINFVLSFIKKVVSKKD